MFRQPARVAIFIGQAASDVLATGAAPAIGVGAAAIGRAADFIGAGREFFGFPAAIAGSQDAMGIVLAADDGVIADIALVALAHAAFATVLVLTAVGRDCARLAVRRAAKP